MWMIDCDPQTKIARQIAMRWQGSLDHGFYEECGNLFPALIFEILMIIKTI